ncbi:MAG: GNAT family N-acetyltransferase [Pseudomonadota bacterium]
MLEPQDSAIYQSYRATKRTLPQVQEELSDPMNRVFLLFKNGKPVGRAFLSWQGEVSYGLDPEVQGRRCVDILMAEVVEYALSRGMSFLKADIDSFNTRSQRAAERWGFRREAPGAKYYMSLRAV